MKERPLIFMIIEDNYDHAELIRRSFEEHHIANQMIHIADGETALYYLQGNGDYSDRKTYPMPNVILLDLRIPKIDGLQLLTIIKQNDKLKKIPIIILTSSESEKDIVAAYQNSANSYLVKPLDYLKFMDLAKELGFYWIGFNKAPHDACEEESDEP